MRPQIVNIINFIRGAEPRDPNIDLKKPVEEQIKLLRKYHLKGTFLLQYDALLRNDIVDLLKSQKDGLFEFGVWLEVMQSLAEDAGIVWKGRYVWDWHTDVGFSISYTPQQREKIVDVLMNKFKTVFGSYPKSVGSWLIDAHTLSYLSDKYGVIASCNCKDQWGTDGYTLWGGYYNQAYFPSRMNAFTPAQTKKMQINVPVFRMLGSDPIYQYDAGLDVSGNPSSCQGVVTLEPVYRLAGGSEDWVNWYFKENFSGTCLSFGYTQSGQENSFGWDKMGKGLQYQFALIAQKAAANELSVQTLAESGAWYRSQYDVTPASVVAAMSDWKNQGRKSVWYCSRFYRVNLYWENGCFWIRDLFLFDETYEERYLKEPCTLPSCTYDNLPVIDGNRWSGKNIRAGLYPMLPGKGRLISKAGEPVTETAGDEELTVKLPAAEGGYLIIRCQPETMEIKLDGAEKDLSGWQLEFAAAEDAELPAVTISDKCADFTYCGHAYSISADKGSFGSNEKTGRFVISPEGNRILLRTSVNKRAK